MKKSGLLLLALFLFYKSYSEGTKQLWPSGNASEIVGIQFWDNADTDRQFATYGCDEKYRLNITISHTAETIYMGFNEHASTSGRGNLYFRIVNETGTIVYGPTLVPTAAGPGFINTWNEANSGPASLVGIGGYSDLSFSPGETGTFYIEFNPDNSNLPLSIENRRLEYFDVTVANGAVVKDGRLWSSNWDLTTFSFGNRAFSELFVYSNDGVVSKMQLNGIQPFGFEVQTNGTGPLNAGTPFNDRKSRAGKLTYPDFKIFLADPDEVEFPTGSFSGLGANPPYLDGCSGTYCINVDYASGGYAEVLLDFNGNGFEDGVDVVLVKNVIAGYNCFPWDGKDAGGTIVTHGVTLSVKSTILAGMTHYPIYDAENHTNGFIIDVVRPAGLPQPVLFYDDTQVGGGLDLTGCTVPCHTWTGNFGNVRTINTWWYGLSVEENISLVNNQCSPIAVNDTITGSQNSPLNIDVLNIGVDSDSDGDDIWPSQAGTQGTDGTSFAGGTLTVNDNGTPIDLTDDIIIYVPSTGFYGLDSAYYILNDEMEGADTALIYIYVNGDTDGDGISDNADIDADNDGIPDSIEDGGTGFDPSTDSDGDGIPNYLDVSGLTIGFPVWIDFNSDGVNDVYDKDLDGVADFQDLDADNDGIPDIVEAGGVDTNGDGRVDGSGDLDSDGLVDEYDASTGGNNIQNFDSDGDGILNYLDKDSDNDGILDVVESGGVDSNGDGEIDGFADLDSDGFSDNVDGDADNNGVTENSASALQLTGVDSDSDGVPNSYPEGDTDSDGNLNQLDIDSDNDGIIDNIEGQSEAGYVVPSGLDSDGDGIDNSYDSESGNSGIAAVNTDGDASPDYLDTDSDNDLILDIIEGHDANSDGIADVIFVSSDTDNDGLVDVYDTAPIGVGNELGSNSPLQNTDGDANRDWRDTDDDGDTVLTQDETGDIDGNGTKDYLEYASCPNRYSPSTLASSGNADAVFINNGVGDVNNSLNIPDVIYAAVNKNDWVILDLTDIISEGQTIQIIIAKRQTDGNVSRAIFEQSLDGTFIDDALSSEDNPYTYTSSQSHPNYETINYVITGSAARYIRVTRDARGNALDGISYTAIICQSDWDMDGIEDLTDEDDDNDGISDLVEGASDTDGDGIINSLDLDSDNDGIPDAIEANNGVLPNNMLDEGYYSPAYLVSVDVNSNGWYETSEGGSSFSNASFTPLNSDGDSFPDYIDLDADGDGITDAVEANNGVLPNNMDNNGQYTSVFALANDSDQDGIVDDIDPDFGGVLVNNDFDNDGTPNYIDLDSDGDGINDVIEGFDPNVLLTGTDLDNDGNDNAIDPESGNSPANLPDLNCNGLIDYLDGDLNSVTTGPINIGGTWVNGIAPISGSNIVVKAGHTVTLTNNYTLGSLTIENSGILNLAGYNLTINGNLVNDGDILAAGTTIDFSGLCNQTICGDVTFENLTINNSLGVTVNCGTIEVNNVLDLEDGVFDVCSATSFTMTSNGSTSLTASIDGSGTGTITCDVIVERYKEGCANGFITASTPFTTNTVADWGDDLLITGITGGPFSTFWTSLFYYDETVTTSFLDGWTAPANYSSLLQRGKGYYMYAGVADLPAKIIVSGSVDLAPVNFPLSFTNSGVQLEDGYNLLGNPYPSAIDWSSPAGWTKNGCCDAVWIWNECVNQFASAIDGAETNGGSSIIESGQGFWIKAHESGASAQITRDACTQSFGNFRSQDEEIPGELKIHIDGFSSEDETVIKYNNHSSHGHDDYADAVNMLSDVTNMAIYTIDDAGMDCTINAFPFDDEDKEIPVLVRVPRTGSYTLDLTGGDLFPEEVCILLRDNDNGVLTDVRSNFYYTFSMDSLANPENRFTLIMSSIKNVSTKDISCNGNQDGQIIFNPLSSGPFNLTYTDHNGDTLLSKTNLFLADTLLNLDKGSYNVFVENLGASYCGTYSKKVVINSPEELRVNNTLKHVTCDRITLGSIELLVSGGVAPYSYLWSNGTVLDNIDSLEQGVYSCVITDSNQCEKTNTYLIEDDSDVTADFIESSLTINIGETVSFQNISIGANSYFWNFANGESSQLTNASITFDTVGVYDVSLKAYNNNCFDEQIIQIEVVDPTMLLEMTSNEDFYMTQELGELELNFNNVKEQDVVIKINNYEGKVIAIFNQSIATGDSFKVDISKYPQSLYILSVFGEFTNKTFKFIPSE